MSKSVRLSLTSSARRWSGPSAIDPVMERTVCHWPSDELSAQQWQDKGVRRWRELCPLWTEYFKSVITSQCFFKFYYKYFIRSEINLCSRWILYVKLVKTNELFEKIWHFKKGVHLIYVALLTKKLPFPLISSSAVYTYLGLGLVVLSTPTFSNSWYAIP